jgi:hypothetical protein
MNLRLIQQKYKTGGIKMGFFNKDKQVPAALPDLPAAFLVGSDMAVILEKLKTGASTAQQAAWIKIIDIVKKADRIKFAEVLEIIDSFGEYTTPQKNTLKNKLLVAADEYNKANANQETDADNSVFDIPPPLPVPDEPRAMPVQTYAPSFAKAPVLNTKKMQEAAQPEVTDFHHEVHDIFSAAGNSGIEYSATAVKEGDDTIIVVTLLSSKVPVLIEAKAAENKFQMKMVGKTEFSELAKFLKQIADAIGGQ